MQTNTQLQEIKSILLVPPLIKTVEFGEHLRSWRKARGMTQEELATASGVNVSYVSNLERNFSANTKSGKPRPSEDLCSRFAKVLEIPEDEMRVSAGYAPSEPDDRFKLPEGVSVYFDKTSHLTDEQKDKIVNVIKTIVAGVINEQGT